jgi:hypothetical protein
MNWVDHDLPEWFDLDGRLTGLQEVPVVLQFCPVDLGPGLYEPLLRLRQASAEALNRVDREDGGLVLVIRVEMRPMMVPARFDEHPDDDPEESGDFRHAGTLASSEVPLSS